MKRYLTIAAASLLAIGLAACSDSDDEPEEITPQEEVGEAPGDAPIDGVAEEDPAEDAGEPDADGGDLAAEGDPPGDEAAAPDDGLDPAAAVDDPDAGAVEPDAPGFAVAAQDLENTIYMELECGRVVIEMRPDLAPLHVERIKTLTRQGFYDGLTFHRVMEGFMAQTGDPTGTGAGRSELPNVPAEFTDEPFNRGTVGMARTRDVNGANSQFFIMFARSAGLDGEYTVWGNVTDGMDCVDQIARGEPPINPDIILTMNVAADVQ